MSPTPSDALGRVTAVTLGEGSALAYTLDPGGNRTLVQVSKVAPGADSDADGIVDSLDLCPSVADPLQLDNDGDSLGDPCDSDDDNDGIADDIDAFPLDPFEWLDHDGDGIGDNADLDDDVADDAPDNCPFVANPDQADSDHNGLGDACDAAPEVLCTLCLPSWSGWRAILFGAAPIGGVAIEGASSEGVADDANGQDLTGISLDGGTEEQ